MRSPSSPGGPTAAPAGGSGHPRPADRDAPAWPGQGSWLAAESAAAECDYGCVPTLTDLAGRHTNLSSADLECLHALVSDWQLLADLSFADLILWAPVRDGGGWVANGSVTL